ncbi:hypothetical protein ORU26_11175 [Pasteurella multocida]|uniref:hypothetical protein n=1 Tax=Pasteurella multocida TaxID=747 RepID=UPI00225842CC|nr:hypothetical protein [Pasteurella multocida]UZU41449.1 hypothetical protein ORU26_11175 [Pasteurella multocida]
MKRFFALIMIAFLPVHVMSAANMAPIIAAAATTGTRSNQENDRDKQILKHKLLLSHKVV